MRQFAFTNITNTMVKPYTLKDCFDYFYCLTKTYKS